MVKIHPAPVMQNMRRKMESAIKIIKIIFTYFGIKDMCMLAEPQGFAEHSLNNTALSQNKQ
jgi:hypothetical protein